MCILSPQELDEHASNRCRGNAAAEAVATGLVSLGSILFSNLVLTESTHDPFKPTDSLPRILLAGFLTLLVKEESQSSKT